MASMHDKGVNRSDIRRSSTGPMIPLPFAHDLRSRAERRIFGWAMLATAPMLVAVWVGVRWLT